MTKEEIKKALEFCDRDDYFFCGGCAYDDVRNCHDKLQADALNLIIEQEKEIERLKEEIDYFDEFVRRVDDTRWYVMGEPVTTCKTLLKYIEIEKKQAQIDALNKVKTLIFQKDNPHNVPFEEFISANVFCGYIDELIKEVQNADKD